MTEDGQAPAVLVVSPAGADQQLVPVYDRLVVGRVCAGVDEGQRLLIDDRTISRLHLEVWLDLERDEAWLTDHSTNGTRLNGRRIERLVPVQMQPGDRMLAGQTELEFRSARFGAGAGKGKRAAHDGTTTVLHVAVNQMVMVVGDVVSFSTIAETTDDRVLLENIERLFTALRQILLRHHGTLSNFAGDAFFATWEADTTGGRGSAGPGPAGHTPGVHTPGVHTPAVHTPAVHTPAGRGTDDSTDGGADDPGGAGDEAPRAAVAFALEAAATVPKVAAGLDLRDPSGGLLRMGWGVSFGQAAVSRLGGPLGAVLGDATNVAFRLSGIAGRDGWPDVLVTDAVRRAIVTGGDASPHPAGETGFAFTPLPPVQVKGRRQLVEVLGAGQL
jgi:adenylate cyclase